MLPRTFCPTRSNSVAMPCICTVLISWPWHSRSFSCQPNCRSLSLLATYLNNSQQHERCQCLFLEICFAGDTKISVYWMQRCSIVLPGCDVQCWRFIVPWKRQVRYSKSRRAKARRTVGIPVHSLQEVKMTSQDPWRRVHTVFMKEERQGLFFKGRLWLTKHGHNQLWALKPNNHPPNRAAFLVLFATHCTWAGFLALQCLPRFPVVPHGQWALVTRTRSLVFLASFTSRTSSITLPRKEEKVNIRSCRGFQYGIDLCVWTWNIPWLFSFCSGYSRDSMYLETPWLVLNIRVMS